MSRVIKNLFTTKRFAHVLAKPPAGIKYTGKPGAPEKYFAHEKALEEHAARTGKTWANATKYVVPPILIATAYHVYNVEKAHEAHRPDLSKIDWDTMPPEFEYQNIRSKDFFFGNGDETLFWNPKVNHHHRTE